MSTFVWREEYNVGIDLVDRQHRRLAGLLLELDGALRDGHGPGGAEDVLPDLVAYTQTHFRDEEALMETAGFPELADHRSRHAMIAERVRQYRDRVQQEDPGAAVELCRYLQGWLVRHVCETDRRFGDFLREQGRR